MRRVGMIGAGLLILGACSSKDFSFAERPVFPVDVRSVVVLEQRAGAFSGTAYAAADFANEVIQRPIDRLERMLFLGYRVELEALSLEPGPVVEAQPGSCASTKLPTPDEVHTFSVLEQSIVQEEPAITPPQVFERSFEALCPCVSLEIEPVTIGNFGEVRGIGPLSNGRWAIATKWHFVELSSDLTVLSTTTYSGSEGRIMYAGYTLDDDRMVMGAISGALLFWTPGEGIESPPPEPDRGAITALHGAPDGGEIYAMSINGRLSRLTPLGWEVLWGERPPGSDQGSAVAWHGPGRATATQRGGSGIVSVSTSEVRLEPWDSAIDPIQELRFLPKMGLLLISDSNRVFNRESDGQRWVDSEAPFDPSDLAEHRDGFLMSGRGAVQFAPTAGFCQPELTSVGRNWGPFARQRDEDVYLAGVLMTGTDSHRGETRVIRITAANRALE